MAETFSLKAEARAELGTRRARHYRDKGLVPAVMLRKKESPVNLLVPGRDLEKLIKRGARLLELTHPEGKDRVFLKEVQYDHFGDEIYHVDFAKVALDELLTLEVPLILKGKPVGVSDEGGVLDQYVKVLKIQCLPTAIPNEIEAEVGHLKKDQMLALKDVKAPEGVKLLQDPELVLAAVTEHKLEEIVPAAAATPGPAEPEVIKKEKAAEEGAEGEKKEAPKKEEKK